MTAWSPYADLKVLDLTSFWSGPYLTAWLGALGADVVKVESRRRPDGFRFTGAFPDMGEDWYERSGSFQATNLDKRSLALELTAPESREVIERLVAWADVVAENYAVRVVEQFGLTYDDVRAIRPDIVMVRLPGFGLEGPWRDRVGWGTAFEQLAGLAWVTGYPDGAPTAPGGYLDAIVGMHAAAALGAALDHRRRTGEGQLLEVPQVEVGAALTAYQVMAFALEGVAPGRRGNQGEGTLVEGVHPATDGWVAVSVRHAADARAVAALVAEAAPGGPGEPGVDHGGEAIEVGLAAWVAARPAAEAAEGLQAVGVPAEVVLLVEHMPDDPQLAARGFFQELDHPVSGRRRYPGWPVRFSGPGVGDGWQAHRRAAPTLGQHSEEVLAELGLSPGEIAALVAGKVAGAGLAFP